MAADGKALPWPPLHADETETVLSRQEVEALPCTQAARDMAAKEPGIDLGSERVSFRPGFGDVYRYDTAEVEDDPSLGKYVHRARFIVWTMDREKWRFAWVPLPAIKVQ